MNKFFSILSVFALLFFIACSPKTVPSQTNFTQSPTLLKIDDQIVSADEFEYLYQKNNSTQEDSLWNREKIQEYLDLYINFKLKVEEAKDSGMDTSQAFKKEFEVYKNQLAEPYLTPKNVSKKLVKEAYSRLNESVRASHILIMVEQYANPEDTLIAYKKIQDVRKKAVAGENFAELAKTYSDDPSGKINGGDLYYFSSLQMVYPFETAAYNTEKGKISKIVRTRFGYHILKVTDKKPSLGKVQVAHIMIRSSDGMIAEDTLKAYRKIQEIYTQLGKEKDKAKQKTLFENLAKQFSEDYRSRERGGQLTNNGNPEFTSGTLVPPFEEKLSTIKKGEITVPFKTAFGWHIVRLIEKDAIEPFEDLQPILQQKIAKDSRAEIQQAVLVDKLKTENGFSQNKKTDEFLTQMAADSAIQKANMWTVKRFESQNPKLVKDKNLFTVGTKIYTLDNFAAYLEENNKLPAPEKALPFLRKEYQSFVAQEIIDNEKSLLSKKYPEYRFLLQEYYDGILLFKIMEQKVWAKALADQEGLMSFYESNKENYQWQDRAKVTIYNAADKKTLSMLKDSLKLGYYATDNFQPLKLEFDRKNVKLTDAQTKKLAPFALAAKTNPSYVFTIEAAKGIGETNDMMNNRVDAIRAYFKKEGIENVRFVAQKIGNAKVAKAIIQIKIFTTDYKMLEKRFNKENALRLEITEGLFEKQAQSVLSKIDFKKGDYTVEENGRMYYVIVEEIEPTRVKKLEETRGVVISDYQQFLEKEWIAELRKKYEFSTDEKVMQAVLLKNKK
ncbi:parvulin-like peptidyl-prolyl isomerase [Bernardetia litoralis DSM 6794]|uniref:Parvulin-like peptidyl-prolyl isomerase n=1 Tax=Bernardetia litoralis (strain ATCC 23117 / DSM 6794 / NBRC 15988 / NCIMB 1366 / Fx l1 / Sio-4) TaxID=880071 RepID=I4AMZ5_BERLS|nr:peptidylprolyl isomerase [Bernardetia litoralis]AFM05330.1 parvulin-like peptidyl-prolyl isomerase [Bernardetia litoralis DSM 6794]